MKTFKKKHAAFIFNYKNENVRDVCISHLVSAGVVLPQTVTNAVTFA